MGSGTSFAGKEDTIPCFTTKAHIEGAVLLSNNKNFRLMFADFIKSGLWIDTLLQYDPIGTTATHEERLAKEKQSPKYLYAAETNKLAAYSELLVGHVSHRHSSSVLGLHITGSEHSVG
ncbi:hypothetical protein B484DRAFT_410823 [Ochromonadaceae sp. CCMP2298]|nr:hypothetical protein B484DRAFT_410823 [Ochromonadaceae sp. CCMP2298]